MKARKELARIKRHRRICLKMRGIKERPRLTVRRSLNNLYAQVMDDTNNKSLFSLSTHDAEIKKSFPNSGNVKAAAFLGEVFARRAKEKGIEKVVFDRAGYLYHGRIKAFTEGLRKGGLQI